jgi:hypothetical protein
MMDRPELEMCDLRLTPGSSVSSREALDGGHGVGDERAGENERRSQAGSRR